MYTFSANANVLSAKERYGERIRCFTPPHKNTAVLKVGSCDTDIFIFCNLFDS
jgi:hypothetical protein